MPEFQTSPQDGSLQEDCGSHRTLSASPSPASPSARFRRRAGELRRIKETTGRGWVFRSVRIAALAVAVSLVLLVVIFAVSEPRRGALIGRSLIGQPAPDIEGETLNGEFFDLDAHRGRWVVVNFFATWCVGCRVEHPELVAFSDRHAAEGDAIIVTVAYDDKPDAVRSFFAREGGNWPVLWQRQGGVWVSYGVTAVPETYLVSPAGYVVDKLVGPYGVSADQLDAHIAALEATAGGSESSEA